MTKSTLKFLLQDSGMAVEDSCQELKAFVLSDRFYLDSWLLHSPFKYSPQPLHVSNNSSPELIPTAPYFSCAPPHLSTQTAARAVADSELLCTNQFREASRLASCFLPRSSFNSAAQPFLAFGKFICLVSNFPFFFFLLDHPVSARFWLKLSQST